MANLLKAICAKEILVTAVILELCQLLLAMQKLHPNELVARKPLLLDGRQSTCCRWHQCSVVQHQDAIAWAGCCWCGTASAPTSW